jgi:wyosine [tRNA(Phe)-imidazoG37] synthetase (radical SAM superfamily)
MNEQNPIVFGPVPSRRLGKSIGINNIPPKRCTYSCIYCQLGRTHHMQIERETFYDPDDIIAQTKEKIKHAQEKNEHIDYLTIVPDGEPTLDENLGELIIKLKKLEYPVAVITNSSLLFREEVRNELLFADWVSVKIDAIAEQTWKQVDRPHGSLKFDEILEGVERFSTEFSSSLCTETMLIEDVNDDENELEQLAQFIAQLSPQTSYLSIPIRPPAESNVKPASEKTLALAYQIFTDNNISTEYLIGYEGNEFAFTGNAEQDILSITAVHPMREDAVDEFLKKADESWDLIERLIQEQKIVKHTLNNTAFYSRKLPKG